MNTLLRISDTVHIALETSSDSAPLALLLLGPLGAAGTYWMLFRYYRNTDKSHDFEKETAIEAQPATGDDHQIGTVRGTQRTEIDGNNVSRHRQRVKRLS